VTAPRVLDHDAQDDRVWFGTHPARQFRARDADDGTWIIRRRRAGDDPYILLRTLSSTPPPDSSDRSIAVAWFATAYPHWLPEQARKAARKLFRKKRP
jgi:hypothetical protein